MTLDELIDRLVRLRRDCPAAGCATVVGFALDNPLYEAGEVRFGKFDPDFCELIEIPVVKRPVRRRRGHVH